MKPFALLLVAAQKGLCVHHLDVKSVYLNSELKEEVFMK